VSGWKVLGVFLGVLALLVGLTALWIRSVTERRWAAMERETRALLEEAKARDTARAALRGEPVEGNAWDDYRKAFQAGLAIRSDVLAEYLLNRPTADRAAVQSIVVAEAATLEALRQGARKSHARRPVKWEQGEIPSMSYSAALNLAQLAACQARLLSEAGRLREASDLILDAGRMFGEAAIDSTSELEAFSLKAYGLVLDKLRSIVLNGRMSAEDHSELSRQLELLDRSLPRTAHSIANESMTMGFAFMTSPGDTEGWAEASEVARSSWRFGFSIRLMQADAFEDSRAFWKRAAELDEKPWSEVVAGVERLQQEVIPGRNPLTYRPRGLLSCFLEGRLRRAQIRLLRVAAHYRALGKALELDDPFGGKLLTERSGKKLKAWSVGPEVPVEGAPRKPPPADLVLEVER
jgi:hypothetical protein